MLTLLLYVAKFCLLGLLYLAVFIGFRRLRECRGFSYPTFEDIDPGALWLVCETPGIEPTEGQPCSQQLVIGRSETCHFTLDDPFVSVRHATVTPQGDHCTVRDLGSANGSRVNSIPVKDSTTMKEGDCLSIGDVTFRLIRRPL